MKTNKIIALVLMVIMLFSCTACTTIELIIPVGTVPVQQNPSVNQTPNTDTNTPPAVESTAAPVPEQTTAAPTPEQTTAGSAAPEQTTAAAPEQTTAAAPSQNNGMPTTKADIAKLYCDAYNKMAEAKSITRTYDYTSNYNNIVNVNNNDTLKGIAQTLMTQFMVENTDPLAVTVADIAPVGVTNLNIDPNLLSNATCADKGSYYEVVLYSTGTDDKYEVDSAPVTGSAGSFAPLLRSEDVSGAAGSAIKFEGLHSWYATATATAKIDKATGRMTDLEFKCPCILHFDQVTAAFVIKIQNCEVGLLFHQIFKAEY